MTIKGDVEERGVNKREWRIWSQRTREDVRRISFCRRRHAHGPEDYTQRDHNTCGGDHDKIGVAEIEKRSVAKMGKDWKRMVG